MGETICKKCGGINNPEEDCSPSLWCTCPVGDYEEDSSKNDDLDPSEVEDYYELEE